MTSLIRLITVIEELSHFYKLAIAFPVLSATGSVRRTNCPEVPNQSVKDINIIFVKIMGDCVRLSEVETWRL